MCALNVTKSTKQSHAPSVKTLQDALAMNHTQHISQDHNTKAMPFVVKGLTSVKLEKSIAQITPNSCQLSLKTPDRSTINDIQFNKLCTNSEVFIDLLTFNERVFPQLTHPYVHNLQKSCLHFTAVTQITIGSGSYSYTADLLAFSNINQAQVLLPPTMGLQRIVTPLNSSSWSAALLHHPDKAFADYITAGICYGFRIGFSGAQPLRSAQDNMRPAKVNPSVVTDYLRKEINAGRIIGPLPADIIGLIHTSHFGVIPKRHQIRKWRLILDLSHPEHASIKLMMPFLSHCVPSTMRLLTMQQLWTKNRISKS